MTPLEGLELEEDMTFQRRNWTAERIAWAIMALVVVAALAGLFGTGPMSRTVIRDGRGVDIEYERFQRMSSPGLLRLDVAVVRASEGRLSVDLDREFLDTFRLETIRPEPAATTATRRGMRLSFATAGEHATFYLTVRPTRIGFARPLLAVSNGAPMALSVFVYP